jgi:hypothetical protein
MRKLPAWFLPVGIALLAAGSGMAYTLWWSQVVHGHSFWITPLDLWGIFRQAHFVGWGGLAQMYAAPGDAAPGMALLLAPVAMLSGALGLSEEVWAAPSGFPPLAHPTSWLLLGPAEMLAGTLVPCLASDLLLRRLGASRARRAVALLAVSAALWQVNVMWGHAEDSLALGIAFFGILAASEERFAAAGWWFAAAIAFQPLVLLLAPVVLAWGGWRRLAGTAFRMVLPFAVITLLTLLGNSTATLHALLKQPLYPQLGWDTPWLHFTTRISAERLPPIRTVYLHGTAVHTFISRAPIVEVAGSKTRLGAAIVALALGWLGARKRGDLRFALWAATIAFAARCAFEAVMYPYYLAPAVAVGALAALAPTTESKLRRPALALLAGAAATIVSYRHFGEWGWYSVMLVELAVLAAATRPAGSALISPASLRRRELGAPEGPQFR